jgi:hypothetical protein
MARGQKRQQVTSRATPIRPVVIAANPNLGQSPILQKLTAFQYIGKTALTVIGPVSDRHYRFRQFRAIVEVDSRDSESLATLPNLRQIRTPENRGLVAHAQGTSRVLKTMSSSLLDPAALVELRQAYQKKNLTLYLGAGVSLGSGLPTWNQLVLAMYFRAASGDWKALWSPYPNYLFAIAEWQMQRDHEPLEITARKIRQFYSTEAEFFDDLRTTLYAGLSDETTGRWDYPQVWLLRQENSTLDAVAELCWQTEVSGKGLHAVISYNYDNLVETVTAGSPSSFAPVWKSSSLLEVNQLPIIHVHGYIPAAGQGSPPEEIIFTEQQYHSAAHNPYSWSNLSQIQCLSASVGLMVGLSLSDRNMRRLLDAIRITPLRKRQFAILKQPEWQQPKPEELEQIHSNAISYIERFIRSGAKKSGTGRQEQMLSIFAELNRYEKDNYNKLLAELGITPIWYSDHQEVGQILRQIVA